MPHLAAATTAAAARPGGVALPRRTWASPVPGSSAPHRNLRTWAVRREDGGGVHTATGEEEREQHTQRTFYDLLGISAEGSAEEVRAAYRRMALRYHPDVALPGAAAENTRRFIEVQEAYETLSDPSRRASYDRALARGVCRLAFSGSRFGRAARASYHQDQEDKSGWRGSWQDQVAELKRRSMTKDSEENLSWGARMRRRAESLSVE